MPRHLRPTPRTQVGAPKGAQAHGPLPKAGAVGAPTLLEGCRGASRQQGQLCHTGMWP